MKCMVERWNVIIHFIQFHANVIWLILFFVTLPFSPWRSLLQYGERIFSSTVATNYMLCYGERRWSGGITGTSTGSMMLRI